MAARKKRARTPRRARSSAGAGGDGAPARVVYIHGIGKQLAPEACKRAWDAALFGQDVGERSVMAYWADIRHPVAAGAVRAAGLDDVLDSLDLVEAADDSVDVARAVRDAGVPKDEVHAARRYAAGLAQRIESSEPARTRSVEKRALPLPAWARKRITKALTRWLIEDTAAYFFDEEQRKEMQARLEHTLRAVPGPVTLVAHSQGTLIAYDVLSRLGKDVDVELWITLGSPLGVTEVQDHLTKPLRKPAGVRAWRNFADRLDPVALDGELANDFVPKGSVEDVRVVNDDTLRLVGFNPHSSTGYLRTAEVRKTVGRSGDPVARFFLAKDVAAEMSDPTRRLPVLIEIEDVRSGASGQGERATLDQRRAEIVAALEEIVPADRHAEARIDGLRRFVSARLDAAELGALAARREELHAYCVWKNAQKKKLVWRSRDVVHAGAANTAYAALGRGIHWAVLDTGVQGDHPHFAAEETIAAAWDCTRTGSPKRLTKPVDEDGHGTHVAGILAGRAEGEKGRVYGGVAPLAKVHAYRVLDEDGAGEDGWIIKALDHVAELNEQSSGLVIHGVNLSLGGWFDPTVYGCGHSPICAELRRLWQQGVAVVIACGNEGLLTVATADGDVDISTDLSIGDPANLEEAIAVGSVNADKPHVFGISYFSSRGPTADGRAKPDVVAPGERIASCDAAFTRSRKSSWYREDSGTSMAAPHVSGLIAAFLSVRREFIGRPDMVKRILLDNCTDLGRDRYHQGAGLPNLMRMLAST